ncbi:zinc ABC transporter ATP-binding protein AztA [Herbiconiux liukaitaii]|uniref:zinc ABC transporter ATP-binding protein AztA n=1 Tax=Herbiconiux liukaitaii TaxID=3342799 RepID=UPI0035B734B0
MTSSSNPGPWLARLRSVRVDFAGLTVLHPLDVDIEPGVVTVIRGPNGAGKSTLLEVIAGSRAPTSGSWSARGSRAFVPQRAAVSDRLPVTVRDVVTVGAWGGIGPWRRLSAQARASIAASLERLGISALATRPFHELSGGQRQRALLAQGLVRRADLLLLDEPTTGLDDESAGVILEVMREEAERGAGVVCVSHDAAVLLGADRMLRLEEGRLLTRG